jgi:hypothetical protein
MSALLCRPPSWWATFFKRVVFQRAAMKITARSAVLICENSNAGGYIGIVEWCLAYTELAKVFPK